jgi:protein TonB
MRKVYQSESATSGLAVAIIAAVGLTGVLFGFIPFAHRINKPERTLELRKAGAVDLPPQAEETPPPPQIAEEKPPEAPPEPQLADAPPAQVPIGADLEVAVGSGGALAGFGEVRALTSAAPVQDETFGVADLEKRPEPVSQVAPAYPAELRKAKVEGVVTLVFVLDETGRVEDPRVENSTRPEFEKPALDAIRKWRFSPGMREGQAVRTYLRIPMRFRVASS